MGMAQLLSSSSSLLSLKLGQFGKKKNLGQFDPKFGAIKPPPHARWIGVPFPSLHAAVVYLEGTDL